MKKSLCRGLIACASLVALASCQDYEGGFDFDTIKKASYAKDFEKTFGTVDPNQDWSMAGRYTATVSLSESVNGVLKIYTVAPTIAGSELLAETPVVDGKATISFDAVKGSKLLYARVENDGQVIESGYFSVVNNTMNLGNVTRALNNNTVTETKSPYTLNCARMPEDAVSRIVAGNYDSYLDVPAFTVVVNEYYSYDKTYTQSDRVSTPIPNLYKLNGVDFTNHDDGYFVEELNPIFYQYVNKNGETKPGVFKEGEDHINQYFKDGTFDRDVTLVVQSKGEVVLDLMWRGTQFNDAFGYYFYEGDGTQTLTAEQLWNINKYIIVENGTVNGEEKNLVSAYSPLTQYAQYDPEQHWDNTISGFVVDKDGWKDWANMDGMGCTNIKNNTFKPKDMIRGTKLRLVYYDSEGNASYNFPAGTKIGFFLAKTDDAYKVFFSDCPLNYQLTYKTYSKVSPAEDGLNCRPFAAKFNYDGRTFVGFGDESGDCDMNDIVFGATNVKPSTDITPDDLPTPTKTSWIFACEDLGGTFDYDFNDVVWEVSHVAGTTTASVRLLAAGGTLPFTLNYNNTKITSKEEEYGNTAQVFINNPKDTHTITVASDWTLSANKDKFTVAVEGSEGTTYVSAYSKESTTQNNIPQVIILPRTWCWPTESTPINEAYPNFNTWVTNNAPVDWSTPVSGKTVTR